jgi:hypothetical protein
LNKQKKKKTAACNGFTITSLENAAKETAEWVISAINNKCI